ncbi:hypothetical protein Q1695_008098 [Nippostrongylus brasiliensis]|nr:hypothetical protein Q1695_008098 [Nippostrongylus brasiliensis]
MLSLTLLMQLFLLIYLCRVQSNYVLLWRGALPEHGSRTPVESEPNTSSTETEDPEKDRKPPSDATSASKSVSAPPGDGDNVPSALHSEQTPAVDPYLR